MYRYEKFNLKNENYHYYNANILDIWCQENRIVAYVQGTYIYRTEMIIKNDEICNYYCNCLSSEGGMSFCKHLSGVAKYLKENELENNGMMEEEKIYLTKPEKEFKEIAKNIMNVDVKINQLDKTLTYI